MSPAPAEPSAARIAADVAAGRTTARAAVEAALTAVEQRDGAIGAFLETWPDAALRAADAVDRARARGAALGPLAGVPVALKDLFLREGRIASCGSRMLAGFTAPYTATAVARLEAAGAVPIGRTNMDEFAMGSSNEHSAFGPVRNPRDPARVPGGSSGGSAAAVAAGMVPLALGSDTGGSVRQPAAFCGVLGFKPTYGRIPRFGMVAFASSLDTVAPFARHVEDLELALAVLAGPDGRDATALPAEAPEDAGEPESRDALRIGIAEELFDGVDRDVAGVVRAALERLVDAGARTVEVTLRSVRHAIPAYYLICASEASSNLARFDGVRYGHRAPGRTLDEVYRRSRSEGFGPEVKRRILLGTWALLSGRYEERYLKATQVRTLIRQDFEAAFERCDVIAAPTTPTTAFPLGALVDDPLAMYRADALTVPANLAGIPAISVPCGAASGLPVGLQLMAAPLRDRALLAIARRCVHALEGAAR